MDLNELKQNIVSRVGIPEVLLTGETHEELIAQSKAFLAYKKEAQANTLPGSPREAFRKYFKEMTGEETDAATIELSAIEAEAGIGEGMYAQVPDAGEVLGPAIYAGTAKDQFSEFMHSKMDFNPFRI